MPTPAERKALLFLAGIIVLGASVRVVRAARDDGSTNAADRTALARQIAAVDSAYGTDKRPRRAVAGSSRALDRGGAKRSRAHPRVEPGPAVDTNRWVREPLTEVGEHTSRDASATPVLAVDLDVADEREIESLPRIGPVLARRIIEDRSVHGPFGSMEGFERVRGVGPSLAASLRARVTFSGTARPSNAVVDPRLRSPPASSKSSRRERKN